MKTGKYKLLQQQLDTFPVLPATVMRLIQITNEQDCSVNDVVDIIHSDQSLSLTVLKIANSALFGRPKKIDSIKMAVVVLGFNEVRGIALAKALINSFNKLHKQHKPFADKFWEHSFVCGMAARIIAQDLHTPPDIAFMGGLIHDIGKLIMLQTFVEDYDLEHWMTGVSTTEMLHEELEMFSFTHDMLGGQLLKKWTFPENLITAVAYHHRPEKAGQEQELAHIIQLADLLSFYSCNPDLLGEDTISAVVCTTLPEIKSQWQVLGLSLKDEAIADWFTWLASNRDKRFSLEQAFAA